MVSEIDNKIVLTTWVILLSLSVTSLVTIGTPNYAIAQGLFEGLEREQSGEALPGDQPADTGAAPLNATTTVEGSTGGGGNATTIGNATTMATTNATTQGNMTSGAPSGITGNTTTGGGSTAGSGGGAITGDVGSPSGGIPGTTGGAAGPQVRP